MHRMPTRPLPRRLLGWTAAAAIALAGLPGPADAALDLRAGTEHRLKAITYNVGDGSDAKKREDLGRLTALRPHVIGLQEVADREDVVRAVARNNGYRVIFEDASHHNAVLVRKRGVEVLGHGALKISDRTTVHPDTPGTGSGDTVPAKYLNWVRFRANGITWVTGVVHLVPSASRYALNEALHNKQVAASARWFATRTAEPVLMGDFNATPESGLMARLREVAKPWSRASHGDRAIDHHWSKKAATGRVDALGAPDYSSDHRPIRVALVVTR